MQYFRQVVLRVLSLNLIFLFLMFLFRCVFFFYYGKGMDWTGFGQDIIRAFIMGLRLDASILTILNIPVILTFIAMLFLKQDGYFNKILSAIKIYYTFIIGILLIFLCCDFGFYSYFQEHFNIMIYGLLEDDTKAILLTIVHNYNIPLLLAAFVAFFVLVWFLAKIILKTDWAKTKFPKQIGIKTILSLVFIFLSFSVIRGSFGDHPLIVNSSVSSNAFLNKVAVNGVFTLQNAIEFKQRERCQTDYIAVLGYKNNIRQAFADFLNKDIDEIPLENPEDSLMVNYPYNETIESLKPNIIIIAMESFGADLLQYNSPEFDVLGSLKEHFDEDIVFYNFVPAWHSTQQSVEGIITNIGILPGGESRFNSKYQYVDYPQNGHKPYKEKGYKALFLYGGNLGWRNIGKYMNNFGFDEVIGSSGMDEKYSYNEWGVFDGFLFEHLYKLLENGEDSKFIFTITTTNHPPYSLPENHKPAKFVYPQELAAKISGKELSEKRFQAYRYANDELGKFISRIKNSPYKDNTIIAVTGDHNFKSIYHYSQEDFFNSVKVPFYLYIPEKLKPKKADLSVFGSYIDILPTIYSLSLSNVKMPVMGKSLLSDAAENNIVYSPGTAFLGDKNYVMDYRFMDFKNSAFFTWDKNAPGKLVPAQQDEKYAYLAKHADSLVAISDYILKAGYK